MGSTPASVLSFSHVVDAFQVINHMSWRGDKKQQVGMEKGFTSRQSLSFSHVACRLHVN